MVRCEVKRKKFSYYSHGNCSLEDTGKRSEKKRGREGGKGGIERGRECRKIRTKHKKSEEEKNNVRQYNTACGLLSLTCIG